MDSRILLIIGILVFIVLVFQLSSDSSSSSTTPQANSFVEDEIDRYEVTEKRFLPNDKLHSEWMFKNITRENNLKANISLVAAYEFIDQIAIHITSQNMFAKTVFCRYFDENREEIGKPFETNIFPETVAYCSRRKNTKFVSLTTKIDEEYEYPIPLFDRTMKEPKHFFSVCVAPLYGSEPKWLQIAEFIEHYKLQGATYFYFYLANIDEYSRIILDDYVRTGEADIIILHDRFKRPDWLWHMVEIHGCILHSRAHSKWTAFVDIDERLNMTEYDGNIKDYLVKNVTKNPALGSIMFRQRWILKTEEQPKIYTDEKQIVEWMPTMRYTNTSHVGPSYHTVKCIVQSDKIGSMFIHYPRTFYPGYKNYELQPNEGVVRHYRDIRMDSWGDTWLHGIEKFGNFTKTTLESHYAENLKRNLIKRIKYVYGKDY